MKKNVLFNKLDWYIIKKYIGTYFFTILIVVLVVIMIYFY